ncbi:MAG: molybdopterin molybdotransferase MoeA, partial [Terrimicrobiaceae bacterium]
CQSGSGGGAVLSRPYLIVAMIEIEQLWREIDERVASLPGEPATLIKALHRVSIEDVLSPHDLPAFDQSSMDGFAFASLPPGSCLVTGAIAAGSPLAISIKEGSAVRILTGALVPGGTVAIAKQEDCELKDGHVSLRARVCLSAGENIRPRGGVFQTGDILLKSGTRISPGAIALLASAGINSLKIVRQAAVLHLVTGDEIIASGSPLGPGQTYDSNGPMIAALLAESGLEVVRRQLPDDASLLEQQIGCYEGDLLLVSGGSGPGERDHTLKALESSGYTVHCSRLNSRPGKPLIFATRGSQVAFGLPGNPLSHWVCFQAFVKRALRRLHGLPEPEMPCAGITGYPESVGDGRRTWTPGVYWPGGEVRPLPWKHSGDLTPLAEANVLILDPAPGDNSRLLFL